MGCSPAKEAAVDAKAVEVDVAKGMAAPVGANSDPTAKEQEHVEAPAPEPLRFGAVVDSQTHQPLAQKPVRHPSRLLRAKAANKKKQGESEG